MSVFFPVKKPVLPPTNTSHISHGGSPSHSSHHNENGLVTDRELTHEVMAELRRRGVSEHDRTIIEAAASGFRDANGFSSKGIDAREKEELVNTLAHDRRNLGLSETNVKQVDAALDHALEN